MRPVYRRILLAAGAVLAVLIVLLGAVWLARAPIAGAIGRAILERRGIEADFVIERLDGRGLVLRDLRLDDGTVVPRLELDYRLGELLDRRIRSVRVVRPQIRARLEDDGVTVAGFQIGAGGGGPAPAIDLVSITNGRVALDSAAGTLPLAVDLEGGPGRGWRGWLTAEPGALAWRGWGGEVRGGEAEFEMIGDDLLARISLTLEEAAGPQGEAALAMAAATVRLDGLEQGFANASGQASLTAALSDARAADPGAAARRLAATGVWGDAPLVGPLAPLAADRLEAALRGFDAEAALLAEISPQSVSVVLERPVRVDSRDGPDLLLRPMDDPTAGLAFTAARDGSTWRAQVSADVTGGPELVARALDVRFANGLAALRFDGDLAPWGDGDTMLGAERLAAEWERTDAGWRLTASGLARMSGAAWNLRTRDAEIEGGFVLTREAGAVTVRPAGESGPARIAAALFATETTQIEGLSASFAPVAEAGGGAWSVAPGDVPVILGADAIQTRTMRLTGVRLEAPQGGLGLEGQGGVFALRDGTAPVRFAMESADGGAWTARGVRSARVNAASGPLLQRTEAGETFLNAQAELAEAESFAVANTSFRQIDARDLRVNGAVSPEMELDAAAPAMSALIDTLGRTDLALTTGEMTATLSAAPGAPMTMRFSARGGALEGAAMPVALSGMRASGRAAFGAQLEADVDIDNAVVSVPGERQLVSPATLAGGLTVSGGRVRMDLHGEAEGAPDDTIAVTLLHNLETGLGEASVDVPRIMFTPGGPQPQDILAPLKGLVADVNGPAEAHFRAQWYGNALQTSGEVVLDSLDIATRFGPVEDISTRFELSSLAPLLTATPQSVTMGQFNPGIPVESGEIVVSLLPDRRIGLESASWPFAGGEISVQSFVWDPAQAEHRATLQAGSINLAQLVGMFGNDNIRVAGSVSGEMPILIRDGNIIVENAVLSGDEEGFVSYRGEAADAAAQANEQANLAFRALENLRYRVLEVTLDGPVAGEMQLNVTMEGFNPEVLNGFPFRFRIGLSAEFMRLIRDTTQGFRIREQIERSLQEGDGVSLEAGPANAPGGESEGATTDD